MISYDICFSTKYIKKKQESSIRIASIHLSCDLPGLTSFPSPCSQLQFQEAVTSSPRRWWLHLIGVSARGAQGMAGLLWPWGVDAERARHVLWVHPIPCCHWAPLDNSAWVCPSCLHSCFPMNYPNTNFVSDSTPEGKLSPLGIILPPPEHKFCLRHHP